jgi:hypothetical protein
MSHDLERIPARPVVIKSDEGKHRTSTGRWSIPALADHVAAHPETMFDARTLARIGYGSAYPKDTEAARKNIRLLANALEERGVPVVVEFAGRRLSALQVYNKSNEYHQKLMAEEIARRVCAPCA